MDLVTEENWPFKGVAVPIYNPNLTLNNNHKNYTFKERRLLYKGFCHSK